jgi:hypothetical protein
MNPHGCPPVAATAVFAAAAIFASIIAASLIVLEIPAGKMTTQASMDDGLSASETAAVPVRAVRVIVASPYRH